MFSLHVMSNLDDHDLALTDEFARDGEVVLFSSPGLTSTGCTPTPPRRPPTMPRPSSTRCPTIIDSLVDFVSGRLPSTGSRTGWIWCDA
ncbi:hypothetical protein Pme01_28290 [Planosporangium mesophilum]|uniref:Uncharacterized protein n=1 Tax=Planosporangium mesophilum TaxID=689768 RepID=A0A8J3TDM1_9ACTN|nr:hypothetical protein Pme01_28290 [Planosporangium mesophilum]